MYLGYNLSLMLLTVNGVSIRHVGDTWRHELSLKLLVVHGFPAPPCDFFQ